MKRIAAALLATSLLLTGCSGDSDEWTSEEYTALIAYCAGLDGINAGGCPGFINRAKGDGCSVETAYDIVGQIAQGNTEDAANALVGCSDAADN